MPARTIKPFQQGDLDNLCGLYSIVNAVAVAVHRRSADSSGGRSPRQSLPMRCFSQRQADELFDSLSHRLVLFEGLPTLDRGLSTAGLAKLLRRADGHLRRRHQTRLVWSKPFHKRKNVGTAALAKCLRHHLEVPYTAVIVGYLDHWSVIWSVSPKRFRLADSSNDLWIAMQRRDAKRCGVHISDIWPTSVFLIRLASI